MSLDNINSFQFDQTLDGLYRGNFTSIYIDGTEVKIDELFNYVTQTADAIQNGTVNKFWYDAYTASSPLIKTALDFSIQNADTSTTGAITNTDWNTFNNKQNTISCSLPLSISSDNITMTQAGVASNGWLSSTDFNTFNTASGHWNINGSYLENDATTNVNFINNTYTNASLLFDVARNIYANTLYVQGYQVITAFRVLQNIIDAYFSGAVSTTGYFTSLNGYQINGTYVINSARDLININTLNASSTVYTAGYLSSNTGLLIGGVVTIDVSRNATFSTVNTSNYYAISGTAVIDSGRNLVNIASITASSSINTYVGYYINGTQIVDSGRNIIGINNLTTSGTNLFNGLTYFYNTLYMNGNMLANTSKELFPSAITHDNNIVITCASSTPQIRIGYWASQNSSGVNTVSVGNYANYNVTTGNYNTALGGHTAYSNSYGSNNTCIGSYAGYYITNTSENTFCGSEAGYLNSGSSNCGFGMSALGYGGAGSTGDDNCAFGQSACRLNYTGNANVGVGRESLYSNTNGNYNVAVGYKSLWNLSTSSRNVAVGYIAGYAVTTGFDNTFLGGYAGYLTTTGYYNVYIGNSAAVNSTTGYENVIIGNQAGQQQQTGIYNVYVGADAGMNYNGGSNGNVALGYRAGRSSSVTPCYNNTFLGCYANGNTTPTSYATGVGMSSACTADYTTAVGSSALASSSFCTSIGYGASSSIDGMNYSVYFNVNVPSITASGYGYNYLCMNSTGRVGPLISSRRYKTDIERTTFNALEMITKLEPVWYCDKDDKSKRKHYGLIAEDVNEVCGDWIAPKDEKGIPMTVHYDKVGVLAVDAIKELVEENKQLKEKVATLENRLNNLLKVLNINYI